MATTPTPGAPPPPGGNADAAIDIQDLVVSYGGKRAVDGLTLRVPRGAIFGFLGPNGSGKTTTIKALLGLRPPSAGRARVLGHDVVSESLAVRARVGYVSEVNSLYDYLTPRQIDALCRDLNGRWNQAIVDRYRQLFGLPERGRVGQFSKGMKSQLALCLALGSEPDLLILDEPTSGLDPMARRQFLNTLVGDIAAEGKTIFFSSHILSEVEAVADWVGIIARGKTLVSGALDQLKQAQRVVKLTYADVPPPEEIAALRALPAVRRVEQEGRGVRLIARGDVDGLLQAARARPYPLRDLEAVDTNLEDLFLESMKEAGDGR
jgi:ABC-2 type transport system ATP-binding protein